jgi:putative transcriptional regulator
MIRVKLRAAMDAYSQRTGERITYAELAEATGLSLATIQSLASREGYNATLDTIDRLCMALRCGVSDLLEEINEGAEA